MITTLGNLIIYKEIKKRGASIDAPHMYQILNKIIRQYFLQRMP